jgi:hypothetical protein
MLDANPHYGLNALRTTRSTQEQRVEDNAFHPVDRLVLKTMVRTSRRNKSQVDRLVLKTIRFTPHGENKSQVDRLVLKTMRFNSPRRNKPAAPRCLPGRRIEHTAFIHRNFIELGRAGGYF